MLWEAREHYNVNYYIKDYQIAQQCDDSNYIFSIHMRFQSKWML